MAQIKNFLPGAEPPREQRQEQPDHAGFLGRPALVCGDIEFFTIGALARALNRAPNTMRDWERLGIIPRGYESNPDSRNGRRRLYTREQILMLRQLAADCSVLHDLRAVVRGSEFSRLAHVLFEQLKEAA